MVSWLNDLSLIRSLYTVKLSGKYLLLFTFLLGFLYTRAGSPENGGAARFVKNKGQWCSDVRFKANLFQGRLYLLDRGLTYLFLDQNQLRQLHDEQLEYAKINAHLLAIDFEGSSFNGRTEQTEPFPETYNYFTGNDPAHWASDVKAYTHIKYLDVYPHIDFEMLSTPQGLKYNFIVHPGANPADIKLRIKGADQLYIDKFGRLQMHTSLGDLIEERPQSFQDGKTIKTNYVLKNGLVTFNLQQPYHGNTDLVIDPKVVFSTFSGSQLDNFGYTATYDNSGNGYSGGTVFEDAFDPTLKFPVTTGAFQMTYGGGVDTNPNIGELSRDAGILKYTPDGSALVYCTFLGGRHNDQPHSMVVNSLNELVILGTTHSDNFPLGPNPFDNVYNGEYDIFIAKLSASGGVLAGSTYLGGAADDGLNGKLQNNGRNISPLGYNYGDIYRGEVIVDENDNIYIASSTNSNNFPVLGGMPYSAAYDGIIARFDAGLHTATWSSCIGGAGQDAAYGLALGLGTSLYICGGTNSNSLPLNGLNKTFQGGTADGFLLHVNRVNCQPLQGTYVGTSEYDQTYFVQVDPSGNPYVAGQTRGAYPVTAPIYNNPNSGQFITKFLPDLSAIQRSMVFGTGTPIPNISPSAFLVDRCERIFFSGWGGNTNAMPRGNGGRTTGLTKTNDAYQPVTDGSDFYLAVFSRNFDTLLYATFFGGISNANANSHEHVDGGTSRFDKNGIVYQSVCGGCGGNSLFPTSSTAWSRQNRSNNCNNALFKIDFENLNQKPVVRDTLYTVTAFDTLDFEHIAYDPDRYDTLNIFLSGNLISKTGIQAPYPVITTNRSVREVRTHFRWIPQCVHVSNDTFKIKVKVTDEACPSGDSSFATISIIVKAPPQVPIPGPICLVQDPQTQKITVNWPVVNQGRYFRNYLLKRRNPDNSVLLLDSINNPAATTYVDLTVVNPASNNYCYFIEAYNQCGLKTDSVYTVCTVNELNSPIDSSYLITATVEANKDIQIWFTKSNEPDFHSYQIYRCTNRQTNTFNFYQEILDVNDTVYTDQQADVQNTSYCYKIVVTDKCGHRSVRSNQGCNIVLTGKAKPFVHTLTWQDYSSWDGGVGSWELERKVDTGGFYQVMYSTGNNQNL